MTDGRNEDRMRNELEARRACLVGAGETLEMVAETLKNARSLDLAKTSLLGPVHERIVLVGEAIRNTDEALAGESQVQRIPDEMIPDKPRGGFYG